MEKLHKLRKWNSISHFAMILSLVVLILLLITKPVQNGLMQDFSFVLGGLFVISLYAHWNFRRSVITIKKHLEQSGHVIEDRLIEK